MIISLSLPFVTRQARARTHDTAVAPRLLLDPTATTRALRFLSFTTAPRRFPRQIFAGQVVTPQLVEQETDRFSRADPSGRSIDRSIDQALFFVAAASCGMRSIWSGRRDQGGTHRHSAVRVAAVCAGGPPRSMQLLRLLRRPRWIGRKQQKNTLLVLTNP